jgi:hypothetical protein
MERGARSTTRHAPGSLLLQSAFRNRPYPPAISIRTKTQDSAKKN